MRYVTQHRFGGPEVLTLAEGPAPEPLPTEVLVRVHATGVNPVEAFIRSGAFPLLGEPPFVLGWEISGVVEHVVPGTGRFRVGDEVYGLPFFPRAAGGYAEYVAAPSRMLARKPAGLDHVHAAALPLVGLTAWQGLVEYAGVDKGQRVLIHGAGGGLGHVAVQIAKARGAYVIGTASAGKHAFVRGLGADEVIDHRRVDFTTAVQDVDVVFDVIGGDNGPRSLTVLRPGGTFVTAVDRTNAPLAALTEAAGLHFIGVGVEPDGGGLEHLTTLVDEGLLVPHVSHVLPPTEIRRAHELIESGHTQAKIVIDFRS
ncbi:NADPH:quinone reductase [Actinoplanes ianthinogenes]|uniref:NADPH:quinone reductase n=1 Tax=Actinoplanes ianthinogenes TaxID=122358 RepID=A0ABM7LNE6_9ACTN|nr:NADP-dependent oxidoreductase [Actinoplanes ianthinogenes]BCJ40807.1 NADPH:quinone reductase [Actinoplanes ianthinogenes]GGR25065.1 NADPH:quinone reductase [Actinoplanes ianthinogenes]